MDVISRNAADRLVGGPVDVRIGIAARRVERRELVREGLAVVGSVGCADERRCKERRLGTGVGRAIRSVRRQHADRGCIDGSVELAEAARTLVVPEVPNSFLKRLPSVAFGDQATPTRGEKSSASIGASVLGIPGSPG